MASHELINPTSAFPPAKESLHPLDFCARSTQLETEPITKISVAPLSTPKSTFFLSHPTRDFEAMLLDRFFQRSITQLESSLRYRELVFSLLRVLGDRHPLKEVHFTSFIGDHSDFFGM